MADGLRTFLRCLRRLALPPGGGTLLDGQLLERFLDEGDEVAFEVLVWRHGPMVLNVCHRFLHRAQDAEDAFQATFLVFVRKARSINKRADLASWLYKVAYRVALRSRSGALKRTRHEQPGAEMAAVQAAADESDPDLRPVLDEEIGRLPEKYRAAVVLCYLEGKSNREAAASLGCAEGTIASRLSRARERLRTQLVRRGLALSAGALTVLMAEKMAPAGVAAALVETTTQAALRFAVQGAVAAGPVPIQAAALAEGVLKTMWLTKLKMMAALVVGLSLLGTGVGGLAYSQLAAAPSEKPGEPAAAPARAGEHRRDFVDVPAQRDGVLLVIGSEIKAGEEVPAPRLVTVKIGGEEKKFRRLREGDTVEEGQLLAQLDDRVARDALAIKKQKVTAADADWQASLKTRDEAEQRYRTMERLMARKNIDIALEDVRAAKLTWDRYLFEEISKKSALETTKLEVKEAQTILGLYEIRSPVRGVIRTMYRNAGEAARQCETVIQIHIKDN